MKTYLDCYPCFLRQALSIARRVGADQQQQLLVVHRVLELLKDIPLGANPPEIAHYVHGFVHDEINVHDPYKEAKSASTQQALTLYPRLKNLVMHSDDALDTAIRLSIAGNIIDLAISEHHDDLWATVKRVLKQPFAVNDANEMREKLAEADHVLFLADNAGETVFDRILVETLPIPVLYAVKGGPILNDATMEDAVAAGLDQCATLMSTGSDAPGTIVALCSEEFRDQYSAAPLIIAKGQANYETLSDAGPSTFCLLQVKCPVIGRDIGAPVGSIILRCSC